LAPLAGENGRMSESSIQPEPSPEQPAAAPTASAPAAPAPDLRKPDGALARMVPYRNPSALTSYYCAVFSLLPVVALLLAPLAVFFGMIGLRRARRNPERRGTAHAWFGIVLGGLMALLNWGVFGYCIWAINYDDTFQRIYREAFGTPASRPEPEPDD
jgi:hypothetical protein